MPQRLLIWNAKSHAGWRFDSQKGSHRQYVHPFKIGKVTIPFHKGKDLPRNRQLPFVNKPD